MCFILNAPFRDIWRRIATDRNRPIVQRSTRNELKSIYTQRKPIYYQSAHFNVETERRSLRDITSYIAFQIGRFKRTLTKIQGIYIDRFPFFFVKVE